MTLIERMEETYFLALQENKSPLRWRLSAAGYTELKARADAVWQVHNPAGEPPKILGLPFEISHDPGQSDFELVLAGQS